MNESFSDIRILAVSYENAYKTLRPVEKALASTIRDAIDYIQQFYEDNDIWEEPTFGWVRDVGDSEIIVNTDAIGANDVRFFYRSTFEYELTEGSILFTDLENLENKLRIALALYTSSELTELENKQQKEADENLYGDMGDTTRKAPKDKDWVPILAA